MIKAQVWFYRVTNVVGSVLLFFSVMLTQSVASTTTTSTTACEGSNIACAKTVTANVSPTGRIWFAWTVDGYLYVNHSDDRGKTYSRPISVNKIPEKIAARGEKRPQIAVDRAGNVYVSWIKKLPQKWTSDIRFSWLKVGDDDFSAPITVNDDKEIVGHSFNEMIVSDIDEVTIVWLDGRNSKAAKKRGEPYVGSSIYWAAIKPSSLKTNVTVENASEGNASVANSLVANRQIQNTACLLYTSD
ncbi:MAG: BNR repeat-containing protein, partial [Pseudomonadales bacterium]|nr:BNR repeat-containing protein [Pseudomonadales bacterium]